MGTIKTIKEQRMMKELAIMNTIFGVFAIIFFISAFAVLIIISIHVTQKGFDACIGRGYSREYCLYTK